WTAYCAEGQIAAGLQCLVKVTAGCYRMTTFPRINGVLKCLRDSLRQALLRWIEHLARIADCLFYLLFIQRHSHQRPEGDPTRCQASKACLQWPPSAQSFFSAACDLRDIALAPRYPCLVSFGYPNIFWHLHFYGDFQALDCTATDRFDQPLLAIQDSQIGQ